MNLYDKASTGIKGFDEAIDNLRYGDNVVWQVDSVSYYRKMVDYFVESTRAENIRLVYIRFANHEPLLEEGMGIKVYCVDPRKGFESFAVEIHN
ncbi:MAG TPA: pyruvate kinase, partial [Candidatus Avimonas sp.]|nr:pyruvate kinase [Candidatus Avimonas sp.]